MSVCTAAWQKETSRGDEEGHGRQKVEQELHGEWEEEQEEAGQAQVELGEGGARPLR